MMSPKKGENTQAVVSLDIEAIVTDGRNMRLKPDAGLAASIERFGLLEPIVVMPEPMDAGGTGYALVAGARRLAAIKKLGWTKVPAYIAELKPEDVAAAALAENDHRKGLSPFEEAYAIRDMLAEGWTVDNVAKFFSKSDRWVTDRVALMQLPDPILKLVHEKALPLNTALALLRCGDQKLMREVLEETKKEPESIRAQEIVAHVHDLVDGANRLWPNIFGKDEGCAVCTRRSLNMPTLFQKDVYYGGGEEDELIEAEEKGGKQNPDICYDGKCYRAKVKASAAAMEAGAKVDGLVVVHDEEGEKSDYPLLDAVEGHKFPECADCGKKGIRTETGDRVCVDRECFKRLCQNRAQKERREEKEKSAAKHGPADPVSAANRTDVHNLELEWVMEQIKLQLDRKAGARVREALCLAAATQQLYSGYDFTYNAEGVGPLKELIGKDYEARVATLAAMPEAELDQVKLVIAERAVDQRWNNWNYAAAVALGVDRNKDYEINDALFERVSFNKAAIIAIAAEAKIELKATAKKAELIGELLNKWPAGQVPAIVAEDFRDHTAAARTILEPKAKPKARAKPKAKAKKKKG